MAEPNELEAWQEVHNKLLIACELAQEAVDAQRMQHRYWMEELVSNLTEDGQLTSTSAWAKPMRPKKTISKKKLNQIKRKRRIEGAATTSSSGNPKKSSSKRKASAMKDKEGADSSRADSSANGPPRKLRIKMSSKANFSRPVATPAKSPYSGNDSVDETPDSSSSRPTDYAATAKAYDASPTDYNSPPQQYTGQNPLQVMAAVAFGTSHPTPSYSVNEPPAYSAYMSSNPSHNSSAYNRRTSNLATYGSLQDVEDEDDEEDAF